MNTPTFTPRAVATLNLILDARNAGTPIILLETDDIHLMPEVETTDRLGRFCYAGTDELSKLINNLSGQRGTAIIVARNFILRESDRALNAQLTEFALNPGGRTLILQTPSLKIPEGLEPYVEVITPPPLSAQEIRHIVETFARRRHEHPTDQVLDIFTANFRGLSELKINELLARMDLEMDSVFDPAAIRRVSEVIVDAKRRILKKEGLLQPVAPSDKEIGGLDRLKQWVEGRRQLLHDPSARHAWAIDAPKGILVCGIPGTGKSLLARVAAKLLAVPLIRFNMGRVLGGLVGESEHNLRRALALAETMSPCVLWIDEIEKAFSSASGASTDSGVGKRIFGEFLTWMQEKEAPCFVFATANDISSIPSEFLRRGRFDRKFYTFMPTLDECVSIFRSVMAPAAGLFAPEVMSPAFLSQIVAYAGGKGKFLTGADIEGLVADAKFICREELERKPTPRPYTARLFDRALRQAIDEARPYGETNRADMARCLVALARHRFAPASTETIADISAINPDSSILPPYSGPRNGYDDKLYEVLCHEIKKLSGK